MSDVIEPALSGRARCRGCRHRIAKDELRFGEAVPNPFGDGEATHWFCLRCAADKRPERFEPVAAANAVALPEREALLEAARLGIRYPRLAQIARAERSPTGRARCQVCREPIAKNDLRVALERSDDGMISAAGFVHARCAATFFGTIEGLHERLQRLSDKLGAGDLIELEAELARGAAK